MTVFNISYLFLGYRYQCHLGACTVHVDLMLAEIDELRRTIEGVQTTLEDSHADEKKVPEYIYLQIITSRLFLDYLSEQIEEAVQRRDVAWLERQSEYIIEPLRKCRNVMGVYVC